MYRTTNKPFFEKSSRRRSSLLRGPIIHDRKG
jgi:hypothetical protein